MQGRWPKGIISHYEFLVSEDNKLWISVSKGEFGNIKNNPIEQIINFDKVKGRYIKLIGLKTVDGSKNMSIGELGVITK